MGGLAQRTFFGVMAATLILLALGGAGPREWLNPSVFVASLHGVADGPVSVMVHVFRLD